MRLIDADALKDYIDAQKGRPFIGCTVGEALKIMTDEQPTIQPKRGKWIYHIDDLFPAESTMEYNQCHAEQPLTCDDEFCPHCGAKMVVTE